jgi:hypothetical protein
MEANMARLAPRANAKAVALYEKLLAAAKIERKGAQMPYTSVNGRMYSLLTPEGTLGLRLSDADRAAFVARYKTKPLVQYGVVMKEYVAVPASLLEQTATLVRYFEASLGYASALSPKPTKRAKAPAKKAGVKTVKRKPAKKGS